MLKQGNRQMQYRDGYLITGQKDTGCSCVLSSHTPLAEAERHQSASGCAYFLVQNEQGNPIGVVSAQAIRERTHSGTEAERRRWKQMPVESVVTGTIDSTALQSGSDVDLRACGSITAASDECRIDCTAVKHQGSLFAVMMPDDLLVSWRTMERSLRQVMDDPVTGLPGRAVLNRHLAAECARARRCGHSVGVILIDIDHFKGINDQYGHAAGDSVLRMVGTAMRSSLRTYDLITRYGGDEFAVLCCGCEHREIEVPMQRLRSAVQQVAAEPGAPRPVPTLSMGACVCHDLTGLSSPELLLAHADECLYFAKHAGRNCSYSVELGAENAVCQPC